ncbi:TonB-dependent receptor [Nitrospirillum iridis]|uniref:Iron complex outermembrane receptor protein n=1 Tax=Nitrospirillum iridis TaxID=765888 RepID=A0A7X0B057_9PROT|nr:TonB-dependent receptor plug domain-containing protein [Nitrospirillum iridis]MBB6253313.1 iron complex outermembrane receptor protein [Nitrospirillum iridis]
MTRTLALRARRNRLARVTTLLVGLPVVAPAWADERPADDTKAAAMDEIIVTARRHAESLERVPIAITAIGGDQLVDRQIRTDSDLQLSAPGLTIRQTQGNNSLTYSIRGQSADTFSGSPSAVVTYLNEVPLSISGASSFYDLDSVQVLKGPQGTLFGRNATGGAVLYTSAKPTDETNAFVRVRLGNLNLREVESWVNVPLVEDKVLLRIAGDLIRRAGYIHNVYNDEYLGDMRRDGVRGSLTVKPSERISNTTVFQFGHANGTNTGASYTYSVYGCGQTNNGFPLTCSAGLLFGPGLDSVAGSGAWAAYLAAHPKAYASGLLAYVAEQRKLGPYVTDHPGGAGHTGTDYNLSNTTIVDLSDDTQVKNIFGWAKSDVISQQPQLGAPFVTILTENVSTGENGNEVHLDSWSDELQLQGKALGRNLTYIVGAYFQRQRTDTIWPQTYFDVSPVIAPSAVTNAFRLMNDTDAVYTQGTYDLTSAGLRDVHFTAGVRYTWEHVGISQLPRSTYTYGQPDQHRTFQDPSWEVGLDYQATPELFTYVKTRGSFRSGGFNGAAPAVNADATQGGNVFASEHTQDIEAGVKYRGEVAGRPATLNIAVYNQWIQDVQRVEFPDPDGVGGLSSIAVTANVPSEEVRGMELEASVLPTDWLKIGGSLAYTQAEFTDGRILLFGQNYLYGPVGDTPRWSGVGYAEVTLPTPARLGDILARVEVYTQASQYFSNAAGSIAPGTRLPGYALVNARVSWSNILGSDLSGALFAKNLLDRAYFVGGMTLASALGQNAAAVGEPRTYGIELSAKF